MLLLSIFATISTAASAEVILNCDFIPSSVAEALMAGAYQMERQHSGLIKNDMAAEVWVNPDNGMWNFVLIRPDDTACILAAGQYWQTYGPPKNPPNL